MKLDRNALRRIINEEAGRLGINLNERVVGPRGVSSDPVRFTWRPDLLRWEATGKIVEDAKDIAIDFAVNPAFSPGEFTCISTIYSGTIRFKWVDDLGNQLKAVSPSGERVHGLDSLLGKVNDAFTKYISDLRTNNPAMYAQEMQHREDHTTRELKPAAAGGVAGAAPVARKLVDPFGMSAPAAPSASPIRRPGGVAAAPGAPAGVSPAMMVLKTKITEFMDAADYLVSLSGMYVERTPDYEEAEEAYNAALQSLRSLLGGE
jgi:hypothetical protein